MNAPRFGFRLPNGASVLSATDGNAGEGVVLALLGGDYVTWRYNAANHETYWGHYFVTDFNAAWKDYVSRCRQLHIEPPEDFDAPFYERDEPAFIGYPVLSLAPYALGFSAAWCPTIHDHEHGRYRISESPIDSLAPFGV